jgi:hypothetical protein
MVYSSDPRTELFFRIHSVILTKTARQTIWSLPAAALDYRKKDWMSHKQAFRAVIEDAGEGGAFVTVPFDVEQVFGKKRVKVKAVIEGEPYRGSLVRMGSACHILGVRKDIRDKIGKTVGDAVEIVLEEDTEPRAVTVPADMAQALESHPAAGAFFHGLSYTHQKAYVRWIEEAKRAETRQGRVARAVELLEQGKKEP